MNAASVFGAMGSYLKRVFRGAWSLVDSCLTTLPYLFKWGELRKEVTEQYPDPISARTADDLPPRTRGLLFNDIEKCTGCRECEKVCPTQCIRVEDEPGADASKIWVSVFDIDFSKCMYCGLCVEVCEPASLTHTRQYEGAAFNLRDLTASFGRDYVTPEQRAKWASLRQQAEDEEGVSL